MSNNRCGSLQGGARHVTYGFVLALSIDELLTENFPVTVLACFLNYDFPIVIGQLIDDELDLLVQF